MQIHYKHIFILENLIAIYKTFYSYPSENVTLFVILKKFSILIFQLVQLRPITAGILLTYFSLCKPLHD